MKMSIEITLLLFYGGEHRTFLDTDDYWFGLKKLSTTVNGETVWDDGNPSTYRNWYTGEPNQNVGCIRYTKDGFRDYSCDEKFYFTCKNSTVAGNFCMRSNILIRHYVFQLIDGIVFLLN